MESRFSKWFYSVKKGILNRHLPTMGRQNKVKKGPQPLFAQNAMVPLCITGFLPFMAHHNISLRFRAGARRVNNFSFSRISISTCKKNRRSAADSILMTFPIASLNCYTPKFSGLPQKLTWSGVNSLSSRSSQSQVMPNFVACF